MNSASLRARFFQREASEWALLKGSALISIGTAVARVLGLAFSLVLATAFSVGDYGAVRYSIAVASLVAIGTQPFGQHVIARFIGKHANDADRVDSVLSNSLLVLPIILLVTLLIAVPTLFHLNTLTLGILAVIAGETLFYTYWGLSAGFQDPLRLTAAYLGSNLVQIIATVLLIVVLGIRSPTLALLIYGLSYILPLALLVTHWPMPGHLSWHLVKIPVIGELLRFSVPVWISHACYVLNTSLDLLLLEQFVTAGQLGAYSLSKTLATVFIFVPAGISTLLMPRIAALPNQTHSQLLVKMLGVSLFVNLIGLVIYVPVVNPFTQRAFGSDYLVVPIVSVLLALDMIATGIHALITALFVGSGRPAIESASRLATLVATLVGAWLFIPTDGITGAAVAMVTGKLVSLLSYALVPLARIRVETNALFLTDQEG